MTGELSLVFTAYNEEQHLPGALASAAGLATETLVVIDPRTSDCSREVAEPAGPPRRHHQPPCRNTDLLGLSPAGAWKLLRAIGRWRRERRGVLTSNFAEAGAFLRTLPELTRRRRAAAFRHRHGRQP